MKSNVLLLACCCFMGLLMLSPVMVWADVIPDDHHLVHRKIFVTNLADFPDIVLIGYITGPTVVGYDVYLLQDNVPVEKGYKFNTLRLFAMQKALLDRQGGLMQIDWAKVAQKTPPVAMLDPAPDTVANSSPLSSETFYYTVQQVKTGYITLKLTRQVLKYNNGQSDRVLTY